MIIGIPHYNDFEGLKRCINSLYASTRVSDKIIIINSDNRIKTIHKEFIYEIEKKIELYNTSKLGPLDAYNRLFKIAKERKQDLFLTQTDVFFPNIPNKDWLKEMQEIAKKEDCGMITCYGGGGISGSDFINGFQWVGAWVIYIPYRIIKKLGGYDEKIAGGWGVDIDFSYAVKQAGLKTYIINYWVQHTPNYVNNHEHEKVDNIEQLKKDAFRYMRKKWKVGEFAE